MLGTGLSEHVLECLDVISPIVAFLVIRFADLPLASRIIESLLEPGQLFVFGNVEEKFENGRVCLPHQWCGTLDSRNHSRPTAPSPSLHQRALPVRELPEARLW